MTKPNGPNVNFNQHGPHAHAPAQPCRSCHAPNAPNRNVHAPNVNARGANANARVTPRPQSNTAAHNVRAALQPKVALPLHAPKVAPPRTAASAPAVVQRPVPKVLQRPSATPARAPQAPRAFQLKPAALQLKESRPFAAAVSRTNGASAAARPSPPRTTTPVIQPLARITSRAPQAGGVIQRSWNYTIDQSEYNKLTGGMKNSTTTFSIGPHFEEDAWVPATKEKPNEMQKSTLNGIATKCHSCGTTNPGTSSGTFIADHQPPSALVRYGLATGYQILVPHCQSCSQAQSRAAAEFVRQCKAQGKNLNWSTWNNTQERESFF